MDKQLSSINQWTKGSNNDPKATQKSDFNSKTVSNYNSFEFLDMSACDESQKLKLQNTLSSPSSSFSTQRERFRSNFVTRNSSIKPPVQQYSAVQYHTNPAGKSQKPNYQFYQTKHPGSYEHDVMRHVSSISSRSFSSEANTFSSKSNSNFNNNISTLSNTTNISSKRLDDNRHYPNTQDKLSKWHSTGKKPPYAGLKEQPPQANHKEAPSVKRTSYHPLSKESNKSFSSCNRNMSPPLTNNYQANTSTSSTNTSSSPSSNSMSNQSGPHQTHYNSQQIQYGSTPMHPQMGYPSATVPLISHYPIHPSYMTTIPPGQPMIPPPYGQHGDRNEMSSRENNIGMQVQNDHQSNSSSQHPMGSNRGSRRGRSRGGNNTMPRRDYQMRHNNQHQQNQQSSLTSNEYGQPLMEQAQQATAVMGSGPYQQFYISYPYYGGPNGGGHLTALPGTGNSATAQNLTGQPLFAIQQPVQIYGYGSPYPIMYNMMPTQAHTMAHQQQDMADNEHNQSQEGSGAPQQIPWQHHVAYQEPPPIFQHSPHLNAGEGDLEFQPHPDEYHMQMINHPSNFHLVAPDQRTINFLEEIVEPEQSLQQEGFIETTVIDNESIEDPRMYQQEMSAVDNSIDTRLLIEKTRDLMIQTTPQELPAIHHISQIQQTTEVLDESSSVLIEAIVPNSQEAKVSPMIPAGTGKIVESEVIAENPNIISKVVSVDNKMIVKNKEKPPAWGAVVVPNLAAQVSLKKPTASVSVSVSAIPNKDVLHLLPTNSGDSVVIANDQTLIVSEVVAPFASPAEIKAVSDQHFPSNQTSFSSIIASKQPQPSPTADSKKTENKQNEIQPLQKQQQIALSERAKQQIVTTITGVGASSQEVAKKHESIATKPVQEEVPVIVEKISQPVKSAAPVNPTPTAASIAAAAAAESRATWAGLFNSSDGSSPNPSRVSAPLPTPLQNVVNETQTATTAKNPEPLTVQPQPQVPGVMSYSAVSAQSLPATNVNFAASVTSIPPQSAASGAISKKLPQSKVNLPNSSNNNDNQSKSAPADQHATKLGDFFSKYKIENHSVSLFPRGLLNKSNYCYINATLQALVACPPFYHLMKAIPQLPPSYRAHTKTPVTDAMVELVSNYSPLPYRKFVPREKGRKDDVPDINRDSAFEPAVILKMLQALRTEMFPVEGRQEDAEEFLSFILNRMNDEMIELKKLVEKPKPVPKKEEKVDDVNGNTDLSVDDDDEWQVISGTRNKSTITRTTDFGRSPISDIFGGKLRLRVHREGDHSSDNIEPFFTLKLVIEKASSVREALEILVGRDQLEGVTCSRTNQEVAAWQQVTLEELPVVLILHLKCFDFKKESCNKILKTVEFPVELKLDPKIIALKNKYQQKQKQYKLFAVVYHDGKEASKGHYITDVFHVGYSSWIRYDDSTVKPVPEHNVLHPKSPRVPYLLYYRRYDTIGGNRDRDHNSNNHQTNQKPTK